MQVETPGLFEVADEWGLIAVMLAPPASDLPERLRVATAPVFDPELLVAAEAVLRSSSEAIYEHLFGPRGEIPLHERAYRPIERHGNLMRDLEMIYERYGFEKGAGPADSIIAMAAFLGSMKRKEGFVRARRQRREMFHYGLASRHLLDVHFPGFVDLLADRLFATRTTSLIHLAHALLSRSGPAVIESYTRSGRRLPMAVRILGRPPQLREGGDDGSD